MLTNLLKSFANTWAAELFAAAVFVLFVVFVLAMAARGEDDPTTPWQPIRAEVAYVHDADTVNVTIHLPFCVDLPGRSLRAYGYDAWETSKVRQTVHVTDAEIKKGLKARAQFMALLETGTFYIEDMSAVQKDPYGRIHARFWVQVMSYQDGKPTVTWVYVPKWAEDHGHCRTPRDKGGVP